LRSVLTFPGDRLKAISGLARYIEMVTKDHYLAGLWKRHLVFQLGWYVLHGGPGSEQRGKFTISGLAPSWSWANIDGIVDTSMWGASLADTFTSIVEIRAASCKTPFGSKTTGGIDLCGWVMPICSRNPERHKPPMLREFRCEYSGGYSLKIKLGLKCLAEGSKRGKPAYPERIFRLDWDIFQPNPSKLLQDCYALPIYFSSNTLTGIVLTLTSTKDFQRVGNWSVGLEDFTEVSYQGSGSEQIDLDETCTRVVPGDIIEYKPGIREVETGDKEEAFMRATSEPTIRTLRSLFGDCDLDFLERASGGRRFITLV
jgi:hypothetical protein